MQCKFNCLMCKSALFKYRFSSHEQCFYVTYAISSYNTTLPEKRRAAHMHKKLFALFVHRLLFAVFQTSRHCSQSVPLFIQSTPPDRTSESLLYQLYIYTTYSQLFQENHFLKFSITTPICTSLIRHDCHTTYTSRFP